MATSRHNKYVSTTDWFSSLSDETTAVTSEKITTTPIVSSGGGTSGGTDIPGITEIPIDNQTIVWNNNVLTVPIDNDKITIDDNGKLTVSLVIEDPTWENVKNKPDWLIDNKISYSEIEGVPDLSNFITKDYVDENVVTITGTQSITGEKNFKGVFKINDQPIIYNSENGYWKLDGDLIVTGGISFYSNDTDYVPSTIMDAIEVDDITISKSNGYLEVIGKVGGASTWDELEGKPSWIGYTKPSYTYSEIKETPDLSVYAYATDLNNTNLEVAKKWTQNNTKIANWDSAYSWGNHANAGYAKKTYVDSTFLPSANYTASDVFAKVKTLDGASSGLDADLLDGKHYSDIVNGNVASATKLQNSRTLWGQSFNGTANVSGNMTSVGSITMTGSINMNNSTTLNAKNSSGTSETWMWPRWSDNNTYLNFGSGGNFYIRNNNSSNCATLNSSGNLLLSGALTMYSDSRKKTIVKEVELSLEQVANAPLVEHYYNSDNSKTTHVSSIAQYWAGLNDWFCKPDENGFYTMEILNAALASAISVAREFERYKEETDKRISHLEEENKQLKQEIEDIKNFINYGSIS